LQNECKTSSDSRSRKARSFRIIDRIGVGIIVGGDQTISDRTPGNIIPIRRSVSNYDEIRFNPTVITRSSP
jgi:hypothetical protein